MCLRAFLWILKTLADFYKKTVQDELKYADFKNFIVIALDFLPALYRVGTNRALSSRLELIELHRTRCFGTNRSAPPKVLRNK